MKDGENGRREREREIESVCRCVDGCCLGVVWVYRCERGEWFGLARRVLFSSMAAWERCSFGFFFRGWLLWFPDPAGEGHTGKDFP